MGKSLRNMIACCVAQTALAGCSGDPLHLGGSKVLTGCVPGAYLGTYECMGADASFAPPPMNGAIYFYLQGERGGATLTIASGASLTGTQQVPTLGEISFVANLSGTVDCTTYKLTGQVSNITFNNSSFMTMVLQNGDLTADYASTTSPPTLVNGAFSEPSPLALAGIPSSTTDCSWQAELHP